MTQKRGVDRKIYDATLYDSMNTFTTDLPFYTINPQITFILRELVNTFQDVHVRINAVDIDSLARLKLRWPGFYMSFPDFQIHEGPFEGFTVTSCDESPIQEFPSRIHRPCSNLSSKVRYCWAN